MWPGSFLGSLSCGQPQLKVCHRDRTVLRKFIMWPESFLGSLSCGQDYPKHVATITLRKFVIGNFLCGQHHCQEVCHRKFFMWSASLLGSLSQGQDHPQEIFCYARIIIWHFFMWPGSSSRARRCIISGGEHHRSPLLLQKLILSVQ